MTMGQTTVAYNRLLTEAAREAEWLVTHGQAAKQHWIDAFGNKGEDDSENMIFPTTLLPNIPTSLHLFGCIFGSESETILESSTSCMVSPMYDPNRVDASGKGGGGKARWATLTNLRKEFADDLDCAVFNPGLKVEVECADDSDNYQWLCRPFSKADPATAIISSVHASPTLSSLRKVLGDAAPLSPIAQPHLNYLFHTKRNKRKSCPRHSHLEPSRESITAPAAKAYRATWDRQEPLTLPPLCSCTEDTRALDGHLSILKRLGKKADGEQHTANDAPALSLQSPGTVPGAIPEQESADYFVEEPPAAPAVIAPEEPLSPPPTGCHTTMDGSSSSPTVLQETEDPVADAAAFLQVQRVCGACGGLQYFPFSFIEIPLTHEISGLPEVCEKIPLPPNTDVFCDGPKVTAAFISKTPQHEWEIYKALFAAQQHELATIYDVCSIHFFPGHQPSDSYWTRQMTNKLPSESVDPTGYWNTPVVHSNDALPLKPPQQYPLNLLHQSPPPFCSRIPTPSFTSPPLRRIFCIARRALPTDLVLGQHISAEELALIDTNHKERLQYSLYAKLVAKSVKLRQQLASKEKALSQVKLQAAILRVSDVSGEPITTPRNLDHDDKKIIKVKAINPKEPSPPSCRSPTNGFRGTKDRSTYQHPGRPPFYQASAAAARLGVSRPQPASRPLTSVGPMLASKDRIHRTGEKVDQTDQKHTTTKPNRN